MEFKPALGAVFAPFLRRYSHWCFSDLDLVLGDLLAWTDEIRLFASSAASSMHRHDHEQQQGAEDTQDLALSSNSSSSSSSEEEKARGQQEEEVGDEEEVDWDIYTYSFGDQWRMYTRGQWTVHRNAPAVNGYFRRCRFMVGDEQLRRLEHSSHYESAEGCYAKVVSTSKVRRIYEIISHNHFMHGWTVTNDPIQPTQSKLRRCACVTR